VSRGDKDSGSGSLLELVMIVAVALGLALGIQAFLVKPYRIPSESMVPTLSIGQRVLVNRIGMRFSDPDVGDVVVFNPPAGAEDGRGCGAEHADNELCPRGTPEKAEQNFIKRIVAGPGDEIGLRDGQVILNGEPLDEPYAQPCGGGSLCNTREPLEIPAGHYFMMGDNRGQSADAREWGPVPRDWIIGPAFATYWPPNRVGLF
jgi:signal peptidase I